MGTTAFQITSLAIVYSTFIQAQIKENIKAPRHWPLWPGTGEFPAQVASNTENVSIWWRHHEIDYTNSPMADDTKQENKLNEPVCIFYGICCILSCCGGISSAIKTNAAGHGTSLISYMSASRLQIPFVDDILVCYASPILRWYSISYH